MKNRLFTDKIVLNDGRQDVSVTGNVTFIYNLGNVFFIDKVLFTETSDVIEVMEQLLPEETADDDSEEKLEDDEEEDFGTPAVAKEESSSAVVFEEKVLDDEKEKVEAKEEDVKKEVKEEENQESEVPEVVIEVQVPKIKIETAVPPSEPLKQLEQVEKSESSVEPVEPASSREAEPAAELPRGTRKESRYEPLVLDFPASEWEKGNIEQTVMFVNNKKISILKHRVDSEDDLS